MLTYTSSAAVLALAAGSLAGVSSNTVLQPVAVPELSTYRSCVPPINIYNGSGLTDAASVANGSPLPGAWPAHGTGGCNNMWHSSCLGRSGSTCEGGDLTPFIVFDLGTICDITGFHLWNHNQVAPAGPSETDRGLRNIEVQVSADGVNYSSAVPFNDMLQAPGSTAYAGDDYALPAAGVRYVKFTVLSNWGSTAATGISELRFIGNPAFGLTGSAVSPATVELCGPQNVTLTTRLVGAQASTGVSVTVSGGPITGSLAMNDQGLDGDATAGDGVYSAMVTVPAGFTHGPAEFAFAASDAQSHSGAGSVSLAVGPCIPTYTEDGDAGDMPETAAVASGSGTLGRIRGSLSVNDVDMFKIRVCDGANASATTFGGPVLDTQLFLFSTDGVGVVFNDDIPDGMPGDATNLSTLIGALTDGDYYLAVTLWDRDPQDASAQALWNDTPYNTVRAPDGLGAANPLASWIGTFAGSGDYVITLTGACFVSDAPACPADIGATGGVPGQDGVLNNNDFVVFIDYFFAENPLADRGTTGGVPGADGAWNNNDFVVFIDQFFAGCGG